MSLDDGVLIQDKLHGALAVALTYLHRECLAARFDVCHFSSDSLLARLGLLP